MTASMQDQLRDYAVQVTSQSVSVDLDEIVSGDVLSEPVTQTVGAWPEYPAAPSVSTRRRGWLVAAAAAVAVLILVGGASLLSRVIGPDTPVADTVVPTTLTESAPTTLAESVPTTLAESVPTTLPDPPSSFTWSRVPHDEAALGGARGQWMRSVTVGGPGLVAVGSVGNDGDANAAVWASVDGLTWSRVPHDEAALGGARGQWMNSVTVGGAGLVAVGSDGRFAAVWTSVDGITWSRVPHDEAVFGGAGDQGMSGVTVGGPGLVAVGVGAGMMTEDEGHVDWQVQAAVWTSVDGITWSRVPHDEAVFGGVGGQGMNSVVAAGSGLVAVGYDQPGDDVPSGRARDAAVWTSVDGVTWSRVPHDVAVFGGTGNQRMYSVAVAGAGLVAVGADGGFYATRPNAVVWTSVDGVTWSRVPHDEAVFGGAEMHSVTVAGAGLVAVGDTSSAGGPEAEPGDSVFVWVAEPDD